MTEKKVMRNCLLLSLIALLVGSHNLASPAVQTIAQPAPEREEYVVYAALLKEMFIGKETKQLVIERYTAVNDSSNSEPDTFIEQLSPLMKETTSDYKEKNKQSVELSDRFELKVKLNFLSRDELKRIFEKRDEKYDGWKAFRQKYPGAGEIITLSRVGFNPDKSQALIFVGYQCDWLCGEGNYILLTKRDGEWKIEKKSMTWIS
jgi:hypothetical protein